MPPVSIFARLRGCLLAVFALALGTCDSADRLTDPSDNPSGIATATPVSFAKDDTDPGNFRGGIPFGTSAQPTTAFGDRFNGALRNIYPQYLLRELAAIKARGGRVVLTFSGKETTFRDAQGHFSLEKWKARVDRFKQTNISSYIADGTIIGHFLMDEPNDPSNWNGHTVPPAMIEELAKYSKQLWPTLPTIIRTYPEHMLAYSSNYRYLDAAWAQYVHRKGEAGAFIRKNVAEAQKKGLALVVGLNIIKGSPEKTELSPNEIESWGSTLLADDYPCAFISWQSDARYLQNSEIDKAMAALADQARKRSSKSCRGTNGQTSGTEPSGPPEPPAPPRPPAPPGPPAPDQEVAIDLKVDGPWAVNKREHLLLTWSGATGSTVDLYREGKLRRNTNNDGRTKVVIDSRRRATYRFRICEKGTDNCSEQVTITVR